MILKEREEGREREMLVVEVNLKSLFDQNENNLVGKFGTLVRKQNVFIVRMARFC